MIVDLEKVIKVINTPRGIELETAPAGLKEAVEKLGVEAAMRTMHKSTKILITQHLMEAYNKGELSPTTEYVN